MWGTCKISCWIKWHQRGLQCQCDHLWMHISISWSSHRALKYWSGTHTTQSTLLHNDSPNIHQYCNGIVAYHLLYSYCTAYRPMASHPPLPKNSNLCNISSLFMTYPNGSWANGWNTFTSFICTYFCSPSGCHLVVCRSWWMSFRRWCNSCTRAPPPLEWWENFLPRLALSWSGESRPQSGGADLCKDRLSVGTFSPYRHSRSCAVQENNYDKINYLANIVSAGSHDHDYLFRECLTHRAYWKSWSLEVCLLPVWSTWSQATQYIAHNDNNKNKKPSL